MGFYGVSAEPGRAVFEMEPGPQHYNPIGSVHGGVALTLLDSAMGCAVHTLLEPGVGYTTLEVKTNFVRPIKADTGLIRCEGIVIHKGSRVATAEGKLTDAGGKLLAHGTTTCLICRDVSFTTRPELRGTFGMVASTHWLASAAGMAVLERGGNAFDAAVATGFTLQVVEPHLNGPGGEVPALLWPVERGEPIALCGQGVAPAAATIERYRELGHELVPGTGVLAACVPGAFGGWLLLLEQFGTWRLEDVLAFAIGYAERRLPVRRRDPRHDRAHRGAPARVARLARAVPAAARGRRALPQPGARRDLPPHPRRGARRLARGGDREGAGARTYEGFVAEEIDRFVAAEGGLLTADDMARWRASLEPVASLEYGGLTVCKTLPWATGPAGLQQLALLDGFDLAELSPAEFVHVVTECAKLAFADRDALYGDAEVPLETLLSTEYNDERRALIGEDASADYTPGLGRLPTVVGAAVTPAPASRRAATRCTSTLLTSGAT